VRELVLALDAAVAGARTAGGAAGNVQMIVTLLARLGAAHCV